MDAKWAVLNPSTPSDAIVRREASKLIDGKHTIKIFMFNKIKLHCQGKFGRI